jgi:hypothetical protein
MAALSACFVLASCQNPHDRTLPTDVTKIDEGTKSAIQKLSPDERALLARYEMRHTLRGDAAALGPVTIGQALQEQREFDNAQAQREAEAAALKAKMQKEHDEAVARLNDAVAIALVSKSYEASDFSAGVYDDTIQLNIAFENKTDKVISGIKGTAVFKNIFGDVITRSNLTMTEEIGAHSKYMWHGSKKYNQFESSDQTLRNTPLEKIKFEFEPDAIVYADGSELKAPDVASSD